MLIFLHRVLLLRKLVMRFVHGVQPCSWGFFTTNSIPTTTDMLKGDEQARACWILKKNDCHQWKNIVIVVINEIQPMIAGDMVWIGSWSNMFVRRSCFVLEAPHSRPLWSISPTSLQTCAASAGRHCVLKPWQIVCVVSQEQNGARCQKHVSKSLKLQPWGYPQNGWFALNGGWLP